jgi:hypothetical protein
MEPRPSEASSHSAIQEIFRLLWNQRLITVYTKPATDPYPETHPRLCVTFRKKLIFYGEELLAPSPTPKLEAYPLSAVVDFLIDT